MKTLTLLAVLCMLSAVPAYAKEIEVALSESGLTISRGSTSAIEVTIKNNQGSDEDVEITLAGALRTSSVLSELKFKVPANSEKKVTLAIMASDTAPENSVLTINAASADTQRWDSKTLSLDIPLVGNGVNGVHSTSTYPGIPERRFHLTLYYDLKLFNQEGVTLKDGDECCVGDRIRAKATLRGDMNGDGGPCDSPPIEFVDDLDAAMKKIESGAYTPTYYRIPFCNYRFRCEKICPQCIGLKDCACAGPWDIVDCSCLRDVAVLCDAKCRNSGIGNVAQEGDEFAVTATGKVEVAISCASGCALFDKAARTVQRVDISTPKDAYYNVDLGPKYADAKSGMTLNAVNEVKTPQVALDTYSYNSAQNRNLVKIDVENKGKTTAIIDRVVLNIPDYKVLYKPDLLMPGEKAEVLLETPLKDIVGLKASIEYTSEKTGCLAGKKFVTNLNVGGCNSDTDCADNQCINPGTADSYCTNMLSEVIKPVNSTQAYSMVVTGECDNRYYSCYSPSRDGNLYAGYDCYNTDNKYHTWSTSSYTMRFDLGRLPKGMKIEAAKLYLPASAVHRGQEISVYAIDESWTPKSCVPGGDICTMPYCPECEGLATSKGSVLGTAYVNAPGLYAIDLSSYIKSAYDRGTQYVSVRVSGFESTDMCGAAGEWKRYSVEFSGPGTYGPYIRVLH